VSALFSNPGNRVSESHVRLGVIALVPDDWSGIVMPRHQVVRRLAQYFPVVWMEPARNWREFLKPFGPRFLAPDRWSEPSPSMEVLNTGWLHPNFHRPGRLSIASLRSRLSSARQRLIARGANRIALYIWRDEFINALDLVEHDFSCYHVDDEYSFSDKEKPNSARELTLMRRVDRVIVHSPALFAKKGHINPNSVLIPNGVDFGLFSSPRGEPPDIATIPHPRIGYAGVIKKQLDFALLVRLAEARPHCSFVLVGPILNVEGKEKLVARLRKLPNVYFLGGKPATELPAYIQHFDVCLMCYELNDYTRYIYPLKLHEYLACGRPTISSSIETVRGFEDVVSIARNDEEWLRAIDAGISDPNGGSLARRATAQAHDWDMLVEKIAKLFIVAPDASRHLKPVGSDLALKH
jgi:glycosyltransferase involved in cell wall biosynthesis